MFNPNYQDFKEVTIVNKKTMSKTTQKHHEVSKVKKLEDDHEGNVTISNVPLSIGLLIQKQRMSLGMKQCDLASKICVKTDIIQKYEAGKIIPDNSVLQKLRRVLNCQIKL